MDALSASFFCLPALITQDPSNGSLLGGHLVYFSLLFFWLFFFFSSQRSALSKSLGVFFPLSSNHHMLPRALGTFFFKRLACKENIQLKKVNSIGWDRVSSGVTLTPARESVFLRLLPPWPLGSEQADSNDCWLVFSSCLSPRKQASLSCFPG